MDATLKKALVLLLVLIASPLSASLTPAELSDVGSTPPPGAMLPVGLRFIDQYHRAYRLVAGSTPTVLLFADYSCKHICGPGITLTAGALHDAGLRSDRDYHMVVIGLDGDGPAMAQHLLKERLQGLSQEAQNIALLTGTPATITAAERALGYHAHYDAAADQFAHDAAIYIFSVRGTLSGLLPETSSTAAELAAALGKANQNAVYLAAGPKPDETLAGAVSSLCYGLAAAHGLYVEPVILALRIGGISMIVGLLACLLFLRHRHRKAA